MMALKPSNKKKPKTASLKFSGQKFSCGAVSGVLHEILTTASLSGNGGSSPQPTACTIVDEFSTNYDIKDHVDLGRVKKALSKPDSAKKLIEATTPQKMLEILGLRGLLLMADYNHLDSANFIKGHLLPQRLGGAGVDENLTPMCQSANSLWSSSFEMLVYKALLAAKKVEDVSKYRIQIDYKVHLTGNMKPWFSNPTPATKTMLAKLPATILGKATIRGFVAKDGSKKKISAAEEKKFPKFNISRSLKL